MKILFTTKTEEAYELEVITFSKVIEINIYADLPDYDVITATLPRDEAQKLGQALIKEMTP